MLARATARGNSEPTGVTGRNGVTLRWCSWSHEVGLVSGLRPGRQNSWGSNAKPGSNGNHWFLMVIEIPVGKTTSNSLKSGGRAVTRRTDIFRKKNHLDTLFDNQILGILPRGMLVCSLLTSSQLPRCYIAPTSTQFLTDCRSAPRFPASAHLTAAIAQPPIHCEVRL